MKLPVQPSITETAPGHFQVDANELAQYTQDMNTAKAEWDKTMAGAENDPDEILRRLFTMFK